uniref:DAZ interacting zinc finger protein 1 like n=1 Tax=Ursus maritimus TaxID=29073 RepID=A0A452UI59_URSMA
MQSPAPLAEGLSGPLFGAYPLPTFKFQPRSESVDWRRISALDVDRVARELDVATLQENIAGVTFCNLDREACSRCGQPVDPVLLKVLRLAQLIIEYLLHCQDCLSSSVAQLEARLRASLGQQQRGQQELGRQADELKGVREESRRRRKMISTLQQLLLPTGAHSYHACHLCDKTFMNATFLRGHIQRRHAGAAEGGKQKKQEQPVEEMLEELRAKLKWTQGELEAQREAERQRQLQEAEITRQKEIEAKNEFDEWKEKERAKLYEEIDKLKKLFWDEFKSVANHNSTLEEKLQALRSHRVAGSNLGSLRDEESEERLRQTQELRVLREKMDTQKAEWKRKMRELQGEHAAQKRELQEQNERLQASLSQDQRKAAAQSQRQISALHAQLQEQARLIASQEEMIRTMSLRKEEGTCKGPKAVDTEEDSSEEDLEDSRDGQQKVLAALRRNPTLLKQFRPILEDTLEEKLESMGIKRSKASRTRWSSKRPSQSPGPCMWHCRPSWQSHPRQLLGAAAATPTPRSRAQGPSGTPASPGPGLSTPPFSSEEDSEEGNSVQRTSLQPPRGPSRMGPQPEDDWDWSDMETSEGSAQPPDKGSGGLASSGTLVQSLVKNLEKQLEAPVKKPAGGVSLFLMPNTGPQRAAGPGRKPQLSDDESDLEISSLEDLPQDLGQREKPKPSSHSKPSEKFGASPWSPGRPKVPGW